MCCAINKAIIDENSEDNGCNNRKENLVAEELFFHFKRSKECGSPENKQNIGDIASEDISDGNACCSFEARAYIDDQFWSGGSEGYDGQSDDDIGDSEFFCY